MPSQLQPLLLLPLLALTTIELTNHSVAQAQTRRSNPAKIRYLPPNLPSDPGEPVGRGRGGGSRGTCKQYEALTALVPATKRGNQAIVGGLTTAQHPTFWFYIPEPLTADSAIEFVLQDDADNYIYRQTFKGLETPLGVLRLSVPTTAKPLEVGRSYRWVFSIYCSPQNATTNVFVRGSIQRVALAADVQRQLVAAKTPLEQATLYAEKGIWYDALTTLGEQRRQNGGDAAINAAWTELLQQSNLGNPATAPIVNWQQPSL